MTIFMFISKDSNDSIQQQIQQQRAYAIQFLMSEIESPLVYPPLSPLYSSVVELLAIEPSERGNMTLFDMRLMHRAITVHYNAEDWGLPLEEWLTAQGLNWTSWDRHLRRTLDLYQIHYDRDERPEEFDTVMSILNRIIDKLEKARTQ